MNTGFKVQAFSLAVKMLIFLSEVPGRVPSLPVLTPNSASCHLRLWMVASECYPSEVSSSALAPALKTVGIWEMNHNIGATILSLLKIIPIIIILWKM